MKTNPHIEIKMELTDAFKKYLELISEARKEMNQHIENMREKYGSEAAKSTKSAGIVNEKTRF